MDKKEYKVIVIDKIKTNKQQPRTIFDQEKIAELALSIQENGLLQPIIVRKLDDEYQIVAGERRYRACVLIGLKEIPCLVSTYDNQQVDTLAIIENIQREDLSVIEEAKAYKTLIEVYHYNQKDLAQKVGKRQSTISNKLRLLRLDNEIKEALNNHQITERHARAMLSLDEQKQKKVLKEILNKSLNVQQTENLINKPEKIKKTIKISKNIKVSLNTLNQAIKMIKDTGVVLKEEHVELVDEYVITIRIKK